MQNLVNSLPTLLGVLLGAVGAMASSTLTDRLRWHREQAVRWDQRRLDAYIAFAATLKQIHATAFRLAAVHRPGSRAPAIDRAAGLTLLADANVRKTMDWEALLLLGDQPTVAVARRWRDAISAVERIARSESWEGEDAWRAAVDEVDLARDAFYLEARQSLGVSGGSVSQFEALRAAGSGSVSA
jgi:hypothetical protein